MNPPQETVSTSDPEISEHEPDASALNAERDPETQTEPGPGNSSGSRIRLIGFGIFTLVLAALFWKPLLDLTALARKSDLYSHVFLVPLISAYFIWIDRKILPRSFKASWGGALGFGLVGVVLIAAYVVAVGSGWELETINYLSWTMISFVMLFVAGCFVFLGAPFLRVAAFPVAFLIFLVPMPTVVEHGLERFSQLYSADAFHLLMKLSGTPVFREGTTFMMPGLEIEVAPQCSGLRSSFVLFITGLLLGQLCLRSVWGRIVLTAATIPLGLLRNGARIFTISMLTMHYDPEIINGPVHSQGGPPFFVASLVPLYLIMLLLRRLERRKPSKSAD